MPQNHSLDQPASDADDSADALVALESILLAQEIAALIMQRIETVPAGRYVGACHYLLPAIATHVLDLLSGAPEAQRFAIRHWSMRLSEELETRLLIVPGPETRQ